jgi:hypothetical protein
MMVVVKPLVLLSTWPRNASVFAWSVAVYVVMSFSSFILDEYPREKFPLTPVHFIGAELQVSMEVLACVPHWAQEPSYTRTSG